jgi:hypothetical protein
MSRRTPSREKAIAWYADHYKLKAQISAHPVYRFVDKKGLTIEEDIWHIVEKYKAHGGQVEDVPVEPRPAEQTTLID